MANPTTNFGWQMPQNTDLVKDLPADFEVFGQAVDTSLMDLKGGTTGQVLSKASNTDMDFTWVAQDDSNAIQNAIVDAKGDLITATAADTPARLAVGANDTVLMADSSTATGLKWGTVSSGGMTLLSTTTLSGTSTTISSISGSYTDLLIIINDPYATGNGLLRISPNGTDSISYYGGAVSAGTVSGTNLDSYSSTNAATDVNNSLCLSIRQYSQTSYGKPFIFSGGTRSSTGTFMIYGGTIRTTSAITSIKIAVDSGYSWSGGQVLIYGVK